MDNIKVSVVVPIYNVEKYLEQCLNSIIDQDFKEYEVILVNDGSTDSSGEIAKRFAEKYDFVKLLDKNNAGLGAARNTAIKYISGKYVVFIDSDDYISETYIRDLYELVSKSDSDIGICAYEKVYDGKGSSQIINLEFDCEKVYSNVETLKLLFTRKIRCYAWDKIYKTSLFRENNIEYLEGKLYEDILASVKLISKSKKISFINSPLYKYRIREGNITSIKSEESITDLNYSIDAVNKYLRESNLENDLKNELVNFNISYTLGSLDMLSIISKYKSKVFYKKYDQYFKNTHLNYSIMRVMKNKSVDKWVKRDFTLFKVGLLPLKNKMKSMK